MRIAGLVLALIFGVLPIAASAQQIDAPMPQRASIHGTVADVQDAAVPGATVTVTNTASGSERTITSNETGWFDVHDLDPSVPYQVTIRARGFADWSSPALTPRPGEAVELDD